MSPNDDKTRLAIVEEKQEDFRAQISEFIKGTEDHRKWVDAEQARHRSEVKQDQDQIWKALKQQSADLSSGLLRIAEENTKNSERVERAHHLAIERSDKVTESGLKRLSAEIKELSTRKPSFGEDNIKTLVGFLVIGVSALLAVIWLRVDPIDTKVDKNEAAASDLLSEIKPLRADVTESKRDIHDVVAAHSAALKSVTASFNEKINSTSVRVDREAARRTIQLDRHLAVADALEVRVRELEKTTEYHRGVSETMTSWLRDDDEAQKQDLRDHIDQTVPKAPQAGPYQ